MCVSLYYIFSRLTYKVKDEINSLPTEIKDVLTNAIRCIKRLKNVKHKTGFGNSKRVKKIIGAYSAPNPSCVLSFALYACSFRNSIFYTENG